MSVKVEVHEATISIAQKAGLVSGADFWNTKVAPGVPSVRVSDGPHGLRKQRERGDHLGLTESMHATCFPPAVALGSSFDPHLLERIGEALGRECLAADVGVLLGPGINIKRSPLCGRNFEYLSEDPIASGILGSALVRGLQRTGVGASLKHFAANNQETDRMRVSADIDERPLREIYLRGFQKVIQGEQPWTVMCSYNRINGTYASEDPWLLTQVLRDEWGFEGVVISDWGAVNDRLLGLVAGLDLEMPGTDGRSEALIIAALQEGLLDETILDRAVSRVAALAHKVSAAFDRAEPYDLESHHALAREAATGSIVLLKNSHEILPLMPDASIAVIGELARTPRYQAGGSSRVTPTRLDDALTAIGHSAASAVIFARGYADDGEPSVEMRAEALAVAANVETVLLFLGVAESQESEGFDRLDIDLPQDQLELLNAVVAVNPRVVVVLSNGGVLKLSEFSEKVPAIVECWLLGQAGGGAIADVLFGIANPSGRLQETIPLRLQDCPAYLDFPGEHGHVRYGEGIFVGYRWFDARELEVSYPFGHGLSYTTFVYGEPEVVVGDEGLVVRVAIINSGDRDGAEVVQVYTSLPASVVTRPPRELKGFAKVFVPAGETREVEVQIPRSDLAYWDTRIGDWVVESGNYKVEIGASSRDLRSYRTVVVVGDIVPAPLSMDSSLGEILEHPLAGPALRRLLDASWDNPMRVIVADPVHLKSWASHPIGRLAMFPGSPFEPTSIRAMLARFAGGPPAGARRWVPSQGGASAAGGT